jgi:hypothetical protein
MDKCFLKGYGDCCDKLTREHYISENILEAITSGKRSVSVGGLSWQSENTLQNIGLGSLQSKILCEKHNSGLSFLDSAAGSFFRTIDAIDKAPSNIASNTQYDGLLLERWLLKVLCGLVKSSGIGGGLKPNFLDLLTGSVWPVHWGLYVPIPSSEQHLNKEFFVQTHTNPETNEILMASYRVAGIPLNLILGTPDTPSLFGKHRPRGFVFELPDTEKRIEFIWPKESNDAIVFKKIGTSKSTPPQHDGWKWQ